jgi:hypothetical protein
MSNRPWKPKYRVATKEVIVSYDRPTDIIGSASIRPGAEADRSPEERRPDLQEKEAKDRPPPEQP